MEDIASIILLVVAAIILFSHIVWQRQKDIAPFIKQKSQCSLPTAQ